MRTVIPRNLSSATEKAVLWTCLILNTIFFVAQILSGYFALVSAIGIAACCVALYSRRRHE